MGDIERILNNFGLGTVITGGVMFAVWTVGKVALREFLIPIRDRVFVKIDNWIERNDQSSERRERHDSDVAQAIPRIEKSLEEVSESCERIEAHLTGQPARRRPRAQQPGAPPP